MEELITAQTAISLTLLIPLVGGLWAVARTFGKINKEIGANTTSIENNAKNIERTEQELVKQSIEIDEIKEKHNGLEKEVVAIHVKLDFIINQFGNKKINE